MIKHRNTTKWNKMKKNNKKMITDIKRRRGKQGNAEEKMEEMEEKIG